VSVLKIDVQVLPDESICSTLRTELVKPMREVHGVPRSSPSNPSKSSNLMNMINSMKCMKDRWGFSNYVRLDVNCISRTLLPAYGVMELFRPRWSLFSDRRTGFSS
jgi:hypothetical protein